MSELERLEKLHELEPENPKLTLSLAAANAHHGRPRRARALLLSALARGAEATSVYREAAQSALDRWSGQRGAQPFHTALGRGDDRAPEAAWRFQSKHADDRFGLPPALRADRVVLVAQSMVVGMRFVRLVAVDTATGRQIWEDERQNLLAVTAPVWLGGDVGAEHIGWAFAQMRGDTIALGLARYNPEDGALVSESWLGLPDAVAFSAAKELVALGDGELGWSVRWTTEEAHRRALIRVDRERGELLSTGPLPWAEAASVVTWAGEVYGIDGEGLRRLSGDGARLHVFDEADPGAHVEGRTPPTEALAVSSGLYFYQPSYRDPAPDGRVQVRRSVASVWSWETGGVQRVDDDEASAARVRFVCASATGQVFAVRRESRESWTLGRMEGALFVAGCVLETSEVLEGCWRGGVVVLRLTSVGGRGQVLIGVDVSSDAPTAMRELWREPLVRGLWHQGPVPTTAGLMGLFGDGIAWLRG